MYTTEPLSHFADEYLDFLYESLPTAASGDGVHTHDDRIEDLSRSAIEAQGRELGGFARRLDRISTRSLTAEEQLERRMLADQIRGRLFELEEVRPWERDPQHYAELLATSLAGQTLFEYAPLEERARRVVSKLRQTPRLIEAAEANIQDPPSIFIKLGAAAFGGVGTFIECDLPRAFRQLEDPHLLGDLADAATSATDAIRRYASHLRDTLAPRSRASFRLGCERFEGRLRHQDGISLGAERLLVIAERELGTMQERFREVAGRVDAKAEPAEVWQRVKARHPAPGQLVPAVRDQLGDLLTFIERNALVTVPDGEPVIVAPTPDFYRWTLPASGLPDLSSRSRSRRITTSPTSTRPGRPSGPKSICGTSISRPSGRCRCTRRTQATFSTSAISSGSSARSVSRPCSPRCRSSRAGRTTASR